mmetsp:Transcript_22082/g.89543  ORF Transcript_22082/g.89543 Transcript_22082/m.89543 type:complete len:122 (+) Transcript_22082:1456-1821(+)
MLRHRSEGKKSYRTLKNCALVCHGTTLSLPEVDNTQSGAGERSGRLARKPLRSAQLCPVSFRDEIVFPSSGAILELGLLKMSRTSSLLKRRLGENLEKFSEPFIAGFIVLISETPRQASYS